MHKEPEQLFFIQFNIPVEYNIVRLAVNYVAKIP